MARLSRNRFRGRASVGKLTVPTALQFFHPHALDGKFVMTAGFICRRCAAVVAAAGIARSSFAVESRPHSVDITASCRAETAVPRVLTARLTQ